MFQLFIYIAQHRDIASELCFSFFLLKWDREATNDAIKSSSQRLLCPQWHFHSFLKSAFT